MPESGTTNGVSLYEYFPHDYSWKYGRRILDGVAALDPTLLHYQERWWLFYTDWARGATNNLCIQYADRLDGEWRPHRMNPVKIDVRSSRPAGPFFWMNGELCRPAQDCVKEYGGAITINKVVELTHHCYREVEVGHLAPKRGSAFPDGLHTIGVTDELIIVDGQRLVFSPLAKLRLRRREQESARQTS